MSQTTREEWAKWLMNYGPEKFYDAFMESAQNAKSRCSQCGLNIFLDIEEGGGIPDWKTANGDYGCNCSPDTNEEETGGHKPYKLVRLELTK